MSVDVIKTWWSELGYRCSDLNEALYYFEQICNEIPTDKISSTFSQDGLEKIPQLFSLLDRVKALEASRKIFNKPLDLRQKNEGSLSPSTKNSVTQDDTSILEYVRGYILCEPKKKKRATHAHEIFFWNNSATPKVRF